MMQLWHIVLACAATAAAAAEKGALSSHTETETRALSSRCKCFPGDDCWPGEAQWTGLNRTVGGRLVATTPIASPCHYSYGGIATYNAASCSSLQSVWPYPETHYSTSSSPMAVWFTNNSCNPFTPPSSPCTAAALVQYAVNASSVADFQATLAFARTNNVRLVIRNTGHDYLGKSTGAGALALWTHFLKDTQVTRNYSSAAYSGPVIKLGAGVQALDAYAAADAAGLAVTGGTCNTVGVVGGYAQGGGLGPLASHVGLGADQVLEWEVVTASGQHLVATPTRHRDLYWALSGGGGGTYAAVFSATLRAHRTMTVSSANLTFSSRNMSHHCLEQVMSTFLSSLPGLADRGAWCSFYVTADAFQLVPVFGPKIPVRELQSLLDPTLGALNKCGASYDYFIKEFSTFQTAYDAMVPLNNVTQANLGGRMIPRSVLEARDSVASLIDAFRSITAADGVVSGIVSNQTRFPAVGLTNSVNPALRMSVISITFGLPYDPINYDANIPLQKKVTDTFMPLLEALSPGGGTYLNEGDFNQPDWQTAFYGTNYARLQRIKDKYDPSGLFYGLTAVGSDKWTYRMHQDGRLCRV